MDFEDWYKELSKWIHDKGIETIRKFLNNQLEAEPFLHKYCTKDYSWNEVIYELMERLDEFAQQTE